jgi:hypothetical protein
MKLREKQRQAMFKYFAKEHHLFLLDSDFNELQDILTKSEEVVCVRCGTVDDYDTVPAGPHLKAVCKNCGKYIKFLKQ